jgi:hypothetical protein
LPSALVRAAIRSLSDSASIVPEGSRCNECSQSSDAGFISSEKFRAIVADRAASSGAMARSAEDRHGQGVASAVAKATARRFVD